MSNMHDEDYHECHNCETSNWDRDDMCETGWYCVTCYDNWTETD